MPTDIEPEKQHFRISMVGLGSFLLFAALVEWQFAAWASDSEQTKELSEATAKTVASLATTVANLSTTVALQSQISQQQQDQTKEILDQLKQGAEQRQDINNRLIRIESKVSR